MRNVLFYFNCSGHVTIVVVNGFINPTGETATFLNFLGCICIFDFAVKNAILKANYRTSWRLSNESAMRTIVVIHVIACAINCYVTSAVSDTIGYSVCLTYKASGVLFLSVDGSCNSQIFYICIKNISEWCAMIAIKGILLCSFVERQRMSVSVEMAFIFIGTVTDHLIGSNICIKSGINI